MADIILNRNQAFSGEVYENRLIEESDKNFQILLLLLSSYWQSTIDGPIYARCLKAVATELTRIRLQLDDLFLNNSYQNLRTDYLYQALTSMVFPDGSPIIKDNDVEFQSFLVDLLSNYFKGSTPASILSSVELIYPSLVELRERITPGTPSDTEFYFDVSVLLTDPRFTALIHTDSSLKFILDVIKPAHTLFTLRNVLKEVIELKSRSDEYSETLNIYHQEEFRKDWSGIKYVDPLGALEPTYVNAESHTF